MEIKAGVVSPSGTTKQDLLVFGSLSEMIERR